MTIEKEFQDETKLPQLTAAEYWEWRTTIAEMQLTESKLKLSSTEYQVLEKDAVISSMRMQNHKLSKVKNAQTNFDESKKEYESMKKRLEDRLGCSLSGKMIDELTFEVKDIPSDNP